MSCSFSLAPCNVYTGLTYTICSSRGGSESLRWWVGRCEPWAIALTLWFWLLALDAIFWREKTCWRGSWHRRAIGAQGAKVIHCCFPAIFWQFENICIYIYIYMWLTNSGSVCKSTTPSRAFWGFSIRPRPSGPFLLPARPWSNGKGSEGPSGRCWFASRSRSALRLVLSRNTWVGQQRSESQSQTIHTSSYVSWHETNI